MQVGRQLSRATDCTRGRCQLIDDFLLLCVFAFELSDKLAVVDTQLVGKLLQYTDNLVVHGNNRLIERNRFFKLSGGGIRVGF